MSETREIDAETAEEVANYLRNPGLHLNPDTRRKWAEILSPSPPKTLDERIEDAATFALASGGSQMPNWMGSRALGEDMRPIARIIVPKVLEALRDFVRDQPGENCSDVPEKPQSSGCYVSNYRGSLLDLIDGAHAKATERKGS
jgi:hypothetical protein